MEVFKNSKQTLHHFQQFRRFIGLIYPKKTQTQRKAFWCR